MTYKDWVRFEAQAIDSDGCTLVSELYQWCCFEHDLVCHYLKDPKDAYRLYKLGHPEPWKFAKDMKRTDGDKQFRGCIQNKSKLGKASPVSWIRYAGVSIGTGWNWLKNRF